MSPEQNKELVRRFIEDVNARRDEASAETYLAPGFVDHGTPDPRLIGPAGWRALRGPIFRAFNPMVIEIENLLAEGDRVAVRFRLRATHTGPLMGIPATGKEVTLTGIDINRLENGQIVERWGNEDVFGLLQQLQSA